MKKVFLFMAVCLPMFIFTACNNDDDKEDFSKSIAVGTWVCESDYGITRTLVLNNNGSGTYKRYEYGDLRSIHQLKYSMTSEKEGIIEYEDDDKILLFVVEGYKMYVCEMEESGELDDFRTYIKQK